MDTAELHPDTDPKVLKFDLVASQQLKFDGIAEAEAATDGDWAADCDDAIEEMAHRGVEFQAADLVREGLVGEPEKHQQWGPRFLKAANRGVIRPVAATRSIRTRTHRSLLHSWIGTGPKDAA